MVRRQLEKLFEGLICGGPVRSGAIDMRMPSDTSLSAFESLNDLMTQVNLAALNAAEGNLLVHAGAVGDHSGQTVLVCGPSGSGKSTLTVRLVEGGHTYLTDETVCLDPHSLLLQPYRKPVSLKFGSQAVLKHLAPAGAHRAGDTWLVPPSAIDPDPLPSARWLPSLLVFPTFRPGAGLQVQRVAPSEAAFLLGRNSSRLALVRGGALPVLARLARRAPAFRIVHDDLNAAAEAVTDLWAA